MDYRDCESTAPAGDACQDGQIPKCPGVVLRRIEQRRFIAFVLGHEKGSKTARS